MVSLPYSDKAVKLSELGGRRLTTAPCRRHRSCGVYTGVLQCRTHAGTGCRNDLYSIYLLGSPRSNVVSVPPKALSEQQGDYFVYERLDEECYAKRRVEIGASDGMRVEISQRCRAGARLS